MVQHPEPQASEQRVRKAKSAKLARKHRLGPRECGRFQKTLFVEVGLRESYSREKGGVQSSLCISGITRIKAQKHITIQHPPPSCPPAAVSAR